MMKTTKPTRYFSNKQEKRVAKTISGKQVANSGATKFSKGDVRTKNFLIECKTCTKEQKSFTLQREWFDKNDEEAFAMGYEHSALVFDFGDGVDRYVIDEKLFKLLLEYIEGDNNVTN